MTTTSARGWIGRSIARVVGLRPGTTADGSLTILCDGDGERWTRRFGTRRWTTTLRSCGSGEVILERVGPLVLHFDVCVDEAGDTVMTLHRVALWSVPIPIRRAIHMTGRVEPDASTTVEVVAFGGSCRYHVEFGGRR